MKLDITKEWLEKMAAAEADEDPTTGKPEYVAPFAPSAADKYYGRIIARYQARIVELEAMLCSSQTNLDWLVSQMGNNGYNFESELHEDHRERLDTIRQSLSSPSPQSKLRGTSPCGQAVDNSE